MWRKRERKTLLLYRSQQLDRQATGQLTFGIRTYHSYLQKMMMMTGKEEEKEDMFQRLFRMAIFITFILAQGLPGQSGSAGQPGSSGAKGSKGDGGMNGVPGSQVILQTLVASFHYIKQ